MSKRSITRSLFFAFLISVSLSGYSQGWNISSDRWTATDGLGRKLPEASQTGSAKSDKYIGMFYWTWHTDGNAYFSPVMNITEILKQYPEAATDKDHPAWQGISPGVFWWDEPLFGYYRTTDEWILRKHAEMLADAGVDVVFFDCTNGSLTWRTSYTVLFQVWDQARKDGVKTPQVAFLLPFSAGSNSMASMYQLYTEIYQPGLYENLWFRWNGKPLIMAYPESLVAQTGNFAGLKFTAAEPFYAINATCPSYNNSIGNLTFSLYKWNTDYATSVAGTPIAAKTFVNFSDNQKLELTFDVQEPGDYVWELSNGTEDVGVWKWTDSNDPAVSFFAGSQVAGNYESEISYDPQFIFTPLTTGTNHTPVAVTSSADVKTVNAIKEFFTFRPGQPDYVNGPNRNDQWGWLENYPQHGFAPKATGGFEEVTVGVAQNASDASGGHASGFNTALTYGRSYTKEAGQDTRPEAYLKGLNFQEQWGRAFELDPDMVFITGWNEWIAGRWFDWDVQPFAFVDQYSAEKSRDIEPAKSWGNKGDVYYMQLVSNVRKFKGMQIQDTVSGSKTIVLDDLAGWTGVKPEYLSYKGNTLHRNHAGQGTELVYTNTTGRNDIVGAKVARDADYLYFYVETAGDLTDKADPKWMRLFIDIDRNKSTGWEGYDFVINRLNPEDSAYVEKSVSSWNWNTAAKAAYVVNGKTLVIKVKRSVFNLVPEKGIDFEFKWSDNMQDEGNIMDFYENGDVAPGERFNYVYRVDWSDDRYLNAELPEGINQGIRVDQYEGVFDTIPSFFDQKIIHTGFPADFVMPAGTAANFGLRYTGFIDVPAKDAYAFTLNTDLDARLYIGSTLVVAADATGGEKSGTIRLMPGKHSITVDYITRAENTKLLDIEIAGSAGEKIKVSPSMLFKYNQSPSVKLAFNAVQNYFSTFDTVAIVHAVDPDGSVANVKVYDNDELLAGETAGEFAVKNFAAGSHSLSATVQDNDGVLSESNILGFTVKPPMQVPGLITVEDYRQGKGVSVTSSTDSDGGKNIRAAYGFVDYPVNVAASGNYHVRFRVPAASGTKTVNIKANGEEIASVDVGNTGNGQSWYDVETDIPLTAGNQVLRFDFEGIVTIHRIEFTFLPTGLSRETENAVVVMPNPSVGEFAVHTQNPADRLELYDLLGQLTDIQPVRNGSTTSRIGSELQPGIYLLVVKSADGSKKAIKLVKRN
jgi:hypothetical protein